MRILALVALIDAIDRQILPGVLSKVQDDLGFSDLQAGLLAGAPVFAGFLVVLPAGYLADRYRRTRIIAIVMASWGVLSALNAVVVGYAQFLGVRTVLGVGETVDNPASASLIADYYPPEIRGRGLRVAARRAARRDRARARARRCGRRSVRMAVGVLDRRRTGLAARGRGLASGRAARGEHDLAHADAGGGAVGCRAATRGARACSTTCGSRSASGHCAR